MATSKITVEASTNAHLDKDFVILQRNGKLKQYFFNVGPKGAPVETEVDDLYKDELIKAINEKVGVTIENNIDHAEAVKAGGYWAENGTLYKAV